MPKRNIRKSKKRIYEDKKGKYILENKKKFYIKDEETHIKIKPKSQKSRRSKPQKIHDLQMDSSRAQFLENIRNEQKLKNIQNQLPQNASQKLLEIDQKIQYYKQRLNDKSYTNQQKALDKIYGYQLKQEILQNLLSNQEKIQHNLNRGYQDYKQDFDISKDEQSFMKFLNDEDINQQVQQKQNEKQEQKKQNLYTYKDIKKIYETEQKQMIKDMQGQYPGKTLQQILGYKRNDQEFQQQIQRLKKHEQQLKELEEQQIKTGDGDNQCRHGINIIQMYNLLQQTCEIDDLELFIYNDNILYQQNDWSEQLETQNSTLENIYMHMKKPRFCIVFLINQHYTILIYQKDELAFFDPLADIKNFERLQQCIKNLSEYIDPEQEIIVKHNTNAWQENDCFCGFYCFIFAHNYITLENKFKYATLFSDEDQQIKKKLIKKFESM